MPASTSTPGSCPGPSRNPSTGTGTGATTPPPSAPRWPPGALTVARSLGGEVHFQHPAQGAFQFFKGVLTDAGPRLVEGDLGGLQQVAQVAIGDGGKVSAHLKPDGLSDALGLAARQVPGQPALG